MKYGMFSACCVALLAATAQAHDGRVYVSGSINNNTCTLSPDSQAIAVDMGTVSNRQFLHPGEGGAWQPFAINLQDCGSTASGVTVEFSGTESENNPELLALNAEAGHATGVSIALYDGAKNAIPLAAKSAAVPLVGGQSSVHLQFYARYIADGGTVSSGTANASATFILNYE